MGNGDKLSTLTENERNQAIIEGCQCGAYRRQDLERLGLDFDEIVNEVLCRFTRAINEDSFRGDTRGALRYFSYRVSRNLCHNRWRQVHREISIDASFRRTASEVATEEPGEDENPIGCEEALLTQERGVSQEDERAADLPPEPQHNVLLGPHASHPAPADTNKQLLVLRALQRLPHRQLCIVLIRHLGWTDESDSWWKLLIERFPRPANMDAEPLDQRLKKALTIVRITDKKHPQREKEGELAVAEMVRLFPELGTSVGSINTAYSLACKALYRDLGPEEDF